LSARTVTHATAPTSMTSVYMHDLADRIIAELDASGQTQREYIWLDDMPVAVVDNVASGNPVIYFVHVDHLMRPARMTAQDTSWVWDVIYAPFGGVSYIWSNPANIDLRFPGQWFQLESGLAYNWHRHYDATLGRYVQPDPLGLTAMLSDGPSVYGYVGGSPFAYADPTGQFAWIPFILAAGTAMFLPETANSPGPNDEIIQSDPAAPYIAGALAGISGSGAGQCFTQGVSRGGFLNRNPYVRLGWGWKGNRRDGHDVFRLAIGNNKSRIHWHIDLWK